MGFFSSSGAVDKNKGAPSNDLLHRMECRLCPLDRAKLTHPKIPASGSKKPLIYMIGEAPGREEDEDGTQFVGKSGRLLRRYIPRDWLKDIRFANVIRCRPPNNRDPETIEIECCRPYSEKDIQETRPEAIFGFGNVPLNWLIGESGIFMWRGRRVPVRVGRHVCWYYPMIHPAAVYRDREDFERRRRRGDDMPESERMFKLDLERALREVDAGLPEPVVHTRDDAEKDVQIILGESRSDLRVLETFLREAAQDECSGLDLETRGLRPYRDDSRILTAAVSTATGTLAFPIHDPRAWRFSGGREEVERLFVDYLKAARRKTVHNAAFEMEWIGHFFGPELLRATPWECSQNQAAILDERVGNKKGGCQSLNFLCLQHFGISIKSLSNVNVARLWEEPLDSVLLYNGIDAKYHRDLYFTQRQRLIDENLLEVYERFQMPRVASCVLTQLLGVPVDQQIADDLSKYYGEKLENAANAIAETREAKEFERQQRRLYNPGSNRDTTIVLRDIMHAEESRRDNGSYGSDETILNAIGGKFCEALLEWRRWSKYKGTYVDPMRAGSPILYPDGKLHPILNTTFAETGRLTSEDPNEQNWPKHEPEGKKIRKAIRPSSDRRVIVSFDYGQIQARNVGMESEDKYLCHALWTDYDIHAEWRDRLAKHVPSWLKQWGEKQARQEAKNNFVFPSFFGAQPPNLARNLKLPIEVCESVQNDFWRELPGVKSWQDRLLTHYRKHGWVQNLSGRKRRGPISMNQLINAPIQADEADIVLEAMRKISSRADAEFSEYDVWTWDFQPIMMIHDDLTFNMLKKDVDELSEIIISDMLSIADDFSWINVPLVVEMSIGDSWYDLKEIGKYRSDTWKGKLNG